MCGATYRLYLVPIQDDVIEVSVLKSKPQVIILTVQSVKRFERSNGLDTALYKTIPFTFLHISP